MIEADVAQVPSRFRRSPDHPPAHQNHHSHNYEAHAITACPYLVDLNFIVTPRTKTVRLGLRDED